MNINHIKTNFIVRLQRFATKIVKWSIRPSVLELVNTETRIWGDKSRLQISPSAAMVNTIYNTSSGRIIVGDYTFTGHNVSLITGTHNYKAYLLDRMNSIPSDGRDIIIGKGVWLCSNVTVLGPCTIEDHAVVAAGAVVLPGTIIKEKTVFAGAPARFIKKIDEYHRLASQKVAQ